MFRLNYNQPNALIFLWYKVWVFPRSLSKSFLFSFWSGSRLKIVLLLHFHHNIIVCIWVSTPTQKHHLLFLAKSPPKSGNSPSPSPFLGNLSRLYWFFVTPSPLKSRIFQWTPKILKSFILKTILPFKSN